MNKIYVFLCFLLVLIFLSISINAKSSDYLVIIDAGHGGLDPGTMSQGILEKDINLSITKNIKEELTKRGIKVLLTRSNDYDLSRPKALYRKKSDFDNRIQMINSSKANLYISIHLNFINNSIYYGPQVFYDQDNLDIAQIMQNKLNDKLGTKRKVKSIPKNTYMYRRLRVSGILVECGFLSNPYERELLTSKKYQKKIASIIADAIIKIQNK